MSIRILVAEDEAKIADFLVRGLREEGYAVEHAADGGSAWRRCGRAAGTWCCWTGGCRARMAWRCCSGSGDSTGRRPCCS